VLGWRRCVHFAPPFLYQLTDCYVAAVGLFCVISCFPIIICREGVPCTTVPVMILHTLIDVGWRFLWWVPSIYACSQSYVVQSFDWEPGLLFCLTQVVSSLQNDSTFLSELFSKLRSPDTPDRCQRDLVGCNFLFNIAYSLCVHACFLDVCYDGPLIKQQHCYCPPKRHAGVGTDIWLEFSFFKGWGGGSAAVQQVLFIQEFCNLSKHLQLPTRSQLFRYGYYVLPLLLFSRYLVVLWSTEEWGHSYGKFSCSATFDGISWLLHARNSDGNVTVLSFFLNSDFESQPAFLSGSSIFFV
jgi:hypothetical protein